MIRLEVNNGYMIRDYDFTPGMTVADMLTKFQNDGPQGGHLQFRNNPVVYDPSQNFSISPDTPLIDGRYYQLSVWIAQEVDDKGVSISKPLQA